MKHHLSVGALVAIAAVLLAGCASNQIDTSAPNRGARSGADTGRSSSGNPPFYEVFGKRYYVLDSSAGYRERGVASWYGREFHGKRTSGGEPYDMHDMTAAHKTLPIPTWVEVTNLENGRSVVVKVNDRGPFVDDRIIDLSYRAAQDLDIIRRGTARVQVRALTEQNPAPPVTTTAAAPPARNGFSIISAAEADTLYPEDRPGQQLYVQVGAFGDSDNAVNLVARLRRSGIANSFIVSSTDGQEIHRVRVGPLASAAEFDRLSSDLRKLGLRDVRLVAED